MVTEVSFPPGTALLVARQMMLSPFSMSEGARKRVLMMLSLLPSRRTVCGGEIGVRKGNNHCDGYWRILAPQGQV